MSISKKYNILNFVKYFVFVIITIIVICPICITLFAAFKNPIQIGSEFPLKPPTELNVDNFMMVFKKGNILLGFKNSMLLILITVFINTFLASMVAYCLTRFDFRLKKVVIFIFLMGMVVPGFVTEIARFGIIKNLGIYNTLLAPIIIYAGTDLMQIYIYTQFIKQIPLSLDESARIDGCTYFGIYWRIIFPNIIPATATLAIIKSVDIMNDMYIPYLYMPSPKLKTMTTALMRFADAKYGSMATVSAGVIVVMIPTIILYLIFQKYIFTGIVAGAVKGG